MVWLRNGATYTFEINLYHEVYCANGGTCGCREEEWEQTAVNRSGEGGLVRGTRRVHTTARISPGETVEFHDAVIGVPGVDDAIRRGVLVREVTPEFVASGRRSRRAAAADPTS